MTDRREEPDFVIDSSGTVRDVRRNRYATPQLPPSGPPGNGRDDRSKSCSPRQTSRTPYLIPIPIGLIIFLLVSLVRCLNQPERDPHTFESESAYGSFSAGKSSYFKGDYDMAIVYFGLALFEENAIGDVYNGRGLAYEARGDHDHALADFDRALETMPDSAMVYNNRALTYLALGDYDQAIVDLDRAIELQPDLGKAYYNRGLTYHALKDYDRAIADLTQAIRLSSNWHPLSTSQQSGPFSEMMESMDREWRAIQSEADLPSAHHSRGLAYLAKGEYAEAIADLSQAVELQPDLSAAYYARSVAYFAEGDFDKGLADCETVVKLGNDPESQGLAEELLEQLRIVAPEAGASLPSSASTSIP